MKRDFLKKNQIFRFFRNTWIDTMAKKWVRWSHMYLHWRKRRIDHFRIQRAINPVWYLVKVAQAKRKPQNSSYSIFARWPVMSIRGWNNKFWKRILSSKLSVITIILLTTNFCPLIIFSFNLLSALNFPENCSLSR